MKIWKTSSKGRLERMVIFYVGLGSSAIAFFCAIGGVGRSDFSEWRSSDAYLMLIFSSFIWLPVVLVTIKRLSTSRIPKEVHLDEESGVVTVIFSTKNKVIIPLQELAFALADNYANHLGLTFYKTFIGTRGQFVKKKITEIIGLRWSISWRKVQIWEMVKELRRLNILEMKAENRDLPLWERIISN